MAEGERVRKKEGVWCVKEEGRKGYKWVGGGEGGRRCGVKRRKGVVCKGGRVGGFHFCVECKMFV